MLFPPRLWRLRGQSASHGCVGPWTLALLLSCPCRHHTVFITGVHNRRFFTPGGPSTFLLLKTAWLVCTLHSSIRRSEVACQFPTAESAGNCLAPCGAHRSVCRELALSPARLLRQEHSGSPHQLGSPLISLSNIL